MNRMAQQEYYPPPQDHRNDEIAASPDRLGVFPEQEETMNNGGVSSSTRKRRRAEGSVENMIRINKTVSPPSEKRTFLDSNTDGFSSTRIIAPTIRNDVDVAGVGGGTSYRRFLEEEVGLGRKVPTASELICWFTKSFDDDEQSKSKVQSLPSTMSLQKNVSKPACFNEHEDNEVNRTIISKVGSRSEGTRNATSTSIIKQIISELEFTKFSEVDMRGKRGMKGILIGHPGLCCRRCKAQGYNSRSRNGRFFPKSAKAMASNKFIIDAHEHFQSCSEYPKESKTFMYKLYVDHISVSEKPNYFRTRLAFCTEVWNSLQEYSSTFP